MWGDPREYVNTDIGFISFGPNHRLKVIVCNFRDENRRNRCHCDIRKWSYGVRTNKYLPSKLGIILQKDMLRNIIGVLDELPEGVKIGEEKYIVASFKKNEIAQVRVQVGRWMETTYVDVREWFENPEMLKSSGWASKGFRVAYTHKDKMNVLLKKAYALMLEQELDKIKLKKEDTVK